MRPRVQASEPPSKLDVIKASIARRRGEDVVRFFDGSTMSWRAWVDLHRLGLEVLAAEGSQSAAELLRSNRR
jgi:hypothetical protein